MLKSSSPETARPRFQCWLASAMLEKNKDFAHERHSAIPTANFNDLAVIDNGGSQDGSPTSPVREQDSGSERTGSPVARSASIRPRRGRSLTPPARAVPGTAKARPRRNAPKAQALAFQQLGSDRSTSPPPRAPKATAKPSAHTSW